MKHATGIHDLGIAGVEEILARALAWKQGCLPGRSLAATLEKRPTILRGGMDGATC